MPNSSAEELGLIAFSRPAVRLLLVVPIIAALVFAYYSARWYIGSTIAENIQAIEQAGVETAETAANLAPSDPRTHWTIATFQNRSFEPGAASAAIPNFEKAVSLSPNDYRLWIDLGRAYSDAGDLARAEKALRQSVALAPSYSYPRWHLGNMLVRADRLDEAFAELRNASRGNAEIREQLLSLAARVYEGDVSLIRDAAGHSPETNASILKLLIAAKRIDEAVEYWMRLPDVEKKAGTETGAGLVSILMNAKRFRRAFEVYASFASEFAAQKESAELINGSFEEQIADRATPPFGWQLTPAPPQTQVNIDRAKPRSGQRSLRVMFRVNREHGVSPFSYSAVVAPSSFYRLTFASRSNDLKTAAPPFVEVLDLADNAVLGKSAAARPGSSEWEDNIIEFRTNPKTEAVIIRLNRASCGAETVVCPIFGSIWYDDFNLERAGGGARAAASGN